MKVVWVATFAVYHAVNSYKKLIQSVKDFGSDV